ncbi:MAG: hypothetical protein J6B32_04790 [Spirochaetaceae bacterium]|nr:hypothetical protein [Spirochaetaceae bacterium]
MINYIIGFGVATLVIVVIARKIIKAKKGEVSGCGYGCGSCSNCPSCGGCSVIKK